jgi:hypothetical protein
VRVIADMDWLLPAKPTTEAIVDFEVLLDRVVAELDATVVCAYRSSSFSRETIRDVLAVHPTWFGHDEEPRFGFVSAGPDGWRLSGEVDLAVRSASAAALNAASSLGD